MSVLYKLPFILTLIPAVRRILTLATHARALHHCTLTLQITPAVHHLSSFQLRLPPQLVELRDYPR